MSAQRPVTGATPMIEILLATYNGAEFVAEQLDTLLHQTYPNWRVLMRDDGSGDNTLAILRRYADGHPDRFVLLDDDDGNLGYVGNFSRLMERSTAGYLAFCDQDDVWLPEKLTVCMDQLRALERIHGSTIPLLVHTDLKVVDRNLNTISPSFWDYRGLDPKTGNDLNRVLAQNVATGCATVFNRSLLDICAPIPPQAAAHDWWIALTAAAFGSTAHIAQPTVLYRQHAGNTIGARSFRLRHLTARIAETLRDFREYQRRMKDVFAQAGMFLERHAGQFSPDRLMLLSDFVDFPDSSAPMRLYYTLKWRIIPLRRLYWLALALSM